MYDQPPKRRQTDLPLKVQNIAKWVIFTTFVAGALSGCGGGGGGSAPASIVPSQSNLSASAAINAEPPASVTVNVVLANLPANAAGISLSYSNNGISAANVELPSTTQAILSVVYKTPASLPVGTYTDQIEMQVCSDAACAHTISGLSATIGVSYAVLPIPAGATPTVDFLQTQIAYQGLQMDPLPPPAIDVTMTLANFGVAPYFTVTGAGTAVSNAYAFAQGTNSGTLTILLSTPISVGAGIFSTPLQVQACLDPACVNPVPGSPFTINVNYTVGTSISVPGPSGYTVKAITQPIRNLVWDAVHSQLYVMLPVDLNDVAHIATLDPTTRVLGTPTPLNANGTGAMDVSDDGQYLYVGLIDGTIQRFSTPALIPDLLIPLGTNAQGAPLYPTDVKVAPGAPHTIAVARGLQQFLGTAPKEADVAIFDDAVRRPTVASGTLSPAAGTLVDYLAWGANATTLYGTGIALPGLSVMSVNAQGVTSSIQQGYVLGSPLVYAFGSLYLDYGVVFNAATNYQATPIPSTLTNPYGLLPSVSGAALFVSNSPIGPVGAPQISALRTSDFSTIASLQLPPLFMEQGHWLMLNGAGLPSPMIVISSTSYIGFITGGFVNQ